MANFSTLDKLDRKIIYELDLNSRIAASKLARNLKVSREVVDYRIKRLIENKYIRSFYTHIHSEKLGYTSYRVYFKIKGMDENEEKKLIEYFCNHENVFWVVSCNGAYDLIIHLAEQDAYKFNEILQEFLQRYDSYFISKDITLVTRLYDFRKSFLSEKSVNYQNPVIYGLKKSFLEIDKKDAEILKLLSNNARIPVIEIAKRLNITSSAVIYRIRELEKKEVITGYSCTINSPNLGLVYCKVFLTLNFGDKKKQQELYQYCLQHQNIIRILYCIGHWDFEMDIMAESTSLFNELLKEIKKRFSEIIRNCESAIITQSYKFDHFPGSYKALK